MRLLYAAMTCCTAETPLQDCGVHPLLSEVWVWTAYTGIHFREWPMAWGSSLTSLEEISEESEASTATASWLTTPSAQYCFPHSLLPFGVPENNSPVECAYEAPSHILFPAELDLNKAGQLIPEKCRLLLHVQWTELGSIDRIYKEANPKSVSG